MKKLSVFFILFTAAVIGVSAQAGAAQQAAEITFTFTRQTGSASNQFAVWIEDTQGKYIKTLYSTKYTANGGWKRRETSIPVWVRQSGISGMTNAQIDVISGATPKTGTLTYIWDGADSKGAAVPAGNYVIVLEATLRWENQVYYRAPILLGQGPAEAKVNVEYAGTPPGNERTMIGDVKARTLR